MNLLLVEDDAGKRQVIRKALLGVSGLEADDVIEASTAVAARRALSTSYFDLLILDIALPRNEGAEPRLDEGVAILEDIALYPERFRTPAHIVGITAYQDVYARAAGQFSSRLLTLLHYDVSSSEWLHGLQARVRHIITASAAESDVDSEVKSAVGIVCALETPELDSVRGIPWAWEQRSVKGDHTIYWRGSFLDSRGAERKVWAAGVGRMGMPNAAVVAMKLVQECRPKYLAITGMAAGIRGRCSIGDVIAADPTWDWGSGKWTRDGEERQRFLPAPHQLRLSVSVREKIRLLARDAPLLSSIRDSWPGTKPDAALAIRIGPLASGAAVLADRYTANAIVEQHRQLLGIDMEAYGVLAAAEECAAPRPIGVALKAVVDFADSEKNDAYQSYASYTSAQVLRYLTERHLEF